MTSHVTFTILPLVCATAQPRELYRCAVETTRPDSTGRQLWATQNQLGDLCLRGALRQPASQSVHRRPDLHPHRAQALDPLETYLADRTQGHPYSFLIDDAAAKLRLMAALGGAK